MILGVERTDVEGLARQRGGRELEQDAGEREQRVHLPGPQRLEPREGRGGLAPHRTGVEPLHRPGEGPLLRRVEAGGLGQRFVEVLVLRQQPGLPRGAEQGVEQPCLGRPGGVEPKPE